MAALDNIHTTYNYTSSIKYTTSIPPSLFTHCSGRSCIAICGSLTIVVTKTSCVFHFVFMLYVTVDLTVLQFIGPVTLLNH